MITPPVMAYNDVILSPDISCRLTRGVNLV